MFKYKLLISYDGTAYSGWQVQPNAISIQGLLEEALETLLSVKTRVVGAGRTDRGVHALGQVAHFVSEKKLDSEVFKRALNGILPYTIRIQDLSSAVEEFHAQYSATRKEYHYHVCLEKAISPFVRLYRHHFPFPMDRALLKEAASYFVGTHDFTTFSNIGTSVKSRTRTLYKLDVIEEEGGVRFEIEGNGFLYKMVRNIVGTILEVAAGRRSLEEIESLFAAKDRRAAGIAAPAKGLFLVRIDYPNTSEKEEKCEKVLPVSSETCLISSGSK